MVFFRSAWRIAAVISLPLLLSACASLGERAPAPIAALIDRQLPPERVLGLDYAAIQALGVAGDCAVLADALEQSRSLPRRDLEMDLLPRCEQDILDAQSLRAEEQRVDALIEEAWLALEARKLRERRAQERRRLAAELQRRQMQKQQALEQQQASRQARREALLARLEAAAIHEVLASLAIEDKPLAYSLGQVSERTLANFLACIEVAYPNKGYQVSLDGRRLVVIAEQASLPRGRLPIEIRLTDNDTFWLLSYLKVAEISAANAQDRFILAQNLLAQSCYGEDGLL